MADLHARRLLVFLLGVAIALTVAIVRPFWQALFLAAVLAAALRSMMEWVARKVRGRRSVAAGALTLAVLLAVVLPVAGLGTIVVRQALEGVASVRQTIESEGVQGLVGRLPGPAQQAARRSSTRCPSRSSSSSRWGSGPARPRWRWAASSPRPARPCSRP